MLCVYFVKWATSRTKWFDGGDSRTPCWDKVLEKIVDLCSFDIGVVSYNVYFVVYNTNKRNMIWLISNAMWKSIYQDYIKA
jgi:hypothetical protein